MTGGGSSLSVGSIFLRHYTKRALLRVGRAHRSLPTQLALCRPSSLFAFSFLSAFAFARRLETDLLRLSLPNPLLPSSATRRRSYTGLIKTSDSPEISMLGLFSSTGARTVSEAKRSASGNWSFDVAVVEAECVRDGFESMRSSEGGDGSSMAILLMVKGLPSRQESHLTFFSSFRFHRALTGVPVNRR